MTMPFVRWMVSIGDYVSARRGLAMAQDVADGVSKGIAAAFSGKQSPELTVHQAARVKSFATRELPEA